MRVLKLTVAFILLWNRVVALMLGRRHKQLGETRSTLLTLVAKNKQTLSLDESQATKSPVKQLTQKEYLIAIRNRLFIVEEQLWLHEYAKSRPLAKIQPMALSKHEVLRQMRQHLLKEYPLTKLRADLQDAQQQNMTYAAMYLNRLIETVNRQLPVSLSHSNQIAVLSSSGQVINLMRGQGAASHRLLPKADVKRQFQHPAFSPSSRYVAFAEMYFKTDGAISAGAKLNALSGQQGRSVGAKPKRPLDPTTGDPSVGVRGSSTATASTSAYAHSEVVVFEVPRDPSKYSASDSMPLFQSGSLPGAPFFLQFSPDEQQLVALCANPGSDGPTSLVTLEWGRNLNSQPHEARRSSSSSSGSSSMGQAVASVGRYASKNTRTILRGNALFFTFTSSHRSNATIVAHCQRTDNAAATAATTTSSHSPAADEDDEEKAVWMLQRSEPSAAGGEKTPPVWTKISDGDANTRWSTPVCHSAGGGDNVVLVENGWLVTRALSRWKRGADGALKVKRLRPVKGLVQFLVSPDSSKVVVLEEDLNTGHYALTAIEGEDALDPANDAAQGRQFDLPIDRLALAFWFSPDSTNLLCLTAAGKYKADLQSSSVGGRGTVINSREAPSHGQQAQAQAQAQAQVGPASEMQWSVYNFPLREVRDYDAFRPTPYFMKTYVPFFTQYAQVFNPWAPDSQSFLYMSSAGLTHVPLVEGKPCLGADRWQNQGATFGTWSRN